jgi:hypothetical protein
MEYDPHVPYWCVEKMLIIKSLKAGNLICLESKDD